MRFGDGARRTPDDVRPSYPSRVDSVDVSSDEAVFQVSSRVEGARSAALRLFTIALASPAENVFRVRIRHHVGRRERGPRFEVAAGREPFAAEERGGRRVLRAGALELWIDEDPWALRFVNAASGEAVTTSPHRAQAMLEAPSGTFTREQLTLGVGEHVYGLGERAQAFVRNGQSLDTWNADAGARSDESAKSVPFFLTSQGYGVFVNSAARVSFEVGTEHVARAQFAVPGHELDYFFILGPTPKQVLARLGALTGRPALPPAWSFGLWLSAPFAGQSDEGSVQRLVDGMAERQLPLHVLQLGRFWAAQHQGGDVYSDAAAFSPPERLLAWLHRRGLRTSVCIEPCLGERSPSFEEGARSGYLLRRSNGDVYQTDDEQAGVAPVDFTNPDATRWFQGELRRLLRMGVDGFEAAGGAALPADGAWADGSDPAAMRNHYSYLYQKAVVEALEQERGKGAACVLARSATATCQRFSVQQSGVRPPSHEAMAEALRGGLSLGLCGFGFWGHDVGGGEGAASASVYKRWLAFALLSSHSRLLAGAAGQAPWLDDGEACDVLRHFWQLRSRLMPYLLATAVQAREANLPVLRAMLLEFPHDPACRALDRQYMLGDGLLVAPVFHERRVEYYLPDGCWTHLLTGETREGGRWFADELDFFSVATWVRPHHVVCTGASGGAIDDDLSRGARLVCGKLDGRVTLPVTLFDAHGDPADRLEVYHDSRRVRVKSPTLSDFQVHLPWAATVADIERGSIVKEDVRAPLANRGVVVRADSGTASFSYGGAA